MQDLTVTHAGTFYRAHWDKTDQEWRCECALFSIRMWPSDSMLGEVDYQARPRASSMSEERLERILDKFLPKAREVLEESDEMQRFRNG